MKAYIPDNAQYNILRVLVPQCTVQYCILYVQYSRYLRKILGGNEDVKGIIIQQKYFLK